jgi:hypothetical protein
LNRLEIFQKVYGTDHVFTAQELERLRQVAELIRADEREACAKVCDDLAAKDKLSNYYAVAAKAIRANRSQTATSVFISNGVKE